MGRITFTSIYTSFDSQSDSARFRKPVKGTEGLESGRPRPAELSGFTPSESTARSPSPLEVGTQTDLIMANRDVHVVNVLESDEICLERTDIPNSFHFASSKIVVKSPQDCCRVCMVTPLTGGCYTSSG